METAAKLFQNGLKKCRIEARGGRSWIGDAMDDQEGTERGSEYETDVNALALWILLVLLILVPWALE